MDIQDSLIVEELKKGAEAGIRLMFTKYQDRLYNWGRREYANLSQHDLLELIDETFLRVIEKIDSFQFKSEKGFRNWIFTIFRNLSIDFLRKTKRVTEYIRLECLAHNPSETKPGEFNRSQWELDRKIYHDYLSPESKEHPLVPKVMEFYDSLDEKNRTILQACARGIPHQEIAEWVGIPTKHVKVYFNRLKKRLKKYLSEEEGK